MFWVKLDIFLIFFVKILTFVVSFTTRMIDYKIKCNSSPFNYEHLELQLVDCPR